MKGILIRWLILTAAIMVASYFISGIEVLSFKSAFFAAAILGVLNTFFRPVLIVLTLPLNILTLGLFTFVINALLLEMASGVIGGFEVHGFWSAVLGSLVVSIVNWILSSLVSDRGRLGHFSLRKKGSGKWD